MAIFSKRHYDWLAQRYNKLITNARTDHDKITLISAIENVANGFEDDNRKFDRERFLTAAIPSEKEFV